MLNESYALSVLTDDSHGMNSLASGGDLNLGIAAPSTMSLTGFAGGDIPVISEDLEELKRKYSGLLIQMDTIHSDLSSADVHYRPSPEEWSILETLGHIIDTDREIWWPRIAAILDTEQASSTLPPYFTNIDQEELVRKHGWQSLPFDDVLAQLMRVRWDHAMKINGIPDTSFDSVGVHTTLGEVSILRILQLLVAHDAYYLVKIRELIEQTGTSTEF